MRSRVPFLHSGFLDKVVMNRSSKSFAMFLVIGVIVVIGAKSSMGLEQEVVETVDN
jgi:hypothetical protein